MADSTAAPDNGAGNGEAKSSAAAPESFEILSEPAFDIKPAPAPDVPATTSDKDKSPAETGQDKGSGEENHDDSRPDKKADAPVTPGKADEGAEADPLKSQVDYYAKKYGRPAKADKPAQDVETDGDEPSTQPAQTVTLYESLSKADPAKVVEALKSAGVEATPEFVKEIVHAQKTIGKQSQLVAQAKAARDTLKPVSRFDETGKFVGIDYTKLFVHAAKEAGTPEKAAKTLTEGLAPLKLSVVATDTLQALQEAAQKGFEADGNTVELALMDDIAKELKVDVSAMGFAEKQEWLDSDPKATRLFNSRITDRKLAAVEAKREAQSKRAAQGQETLAEQRQRVAETTQYKGEVLATIPHAKELEPFMAEFWETSGKADETGDSRPWVDLTVDYAEGKRLMAMLPKLIEQAEQRGRRTQLKALGIPLSEVEDNGVPKARKPAATDVSVSEETAKMDVLELAEPAPLRR